METQVMELHYENIYRYECLRRPQGCKCSGCKKLAFLSPLRIEERLNFICPYISHLISKWFQSLIKCGNATIAWTEEIRNLVTTEGKNDQLTQYFKGSAYTATPFLGLVNNAGFTAYSTGDTAAQIGGTNGWAEGTPYSNATRVAWVGGTASGGSIDNTASVAAFNINATLTVRGGFVATSSTKNGTAGKLYGEADFSVARSVVSGDTLNVTSTFTLV